MLVDFCGHELAITSSKEVKGDADKAVEGGLTVMDETMGFWDRQVVDRVEVWVSLRQEERQELNSYCMKCSSSTTSASTGSSLHPRGCVELSATPGAFVPLPVLSPSLSLSLTIHPSREHQQRFCLGLHQRVSYGEWPAGQRKPTVLSRIYSYCQGELLNGRQLFQRRMKRQLLNQCSVLAQYSLTKTC